MRSEPARSRGIPYLVYIQKIDYGRGKKENDGLRDFKERNGFGRVEHAAILRSLTALGGLPFAWDFTTEWQTAFRNLWRAGFARFAHSGISESIVSLRRCSAWHRRNN